MEQSFFMSVGHSPNSRELHHALGKSYPLWEELKKFVLEYCPRAWEEWNFSKFGWNCRIKDKKRVIIYLTPLEHSFRASLILGGKAVEEALASRITEETRTIISTAKTYAEGTGIRINVKNKKNLKDVKMLTTLKLK